MITTRTSGFISQSSRKASRARSCRRAMKTTVWAARLPVAAAASVEEAVAERPAPAMLLLTPPRPTRPRKRRARRARRLRGRVGLGGVSRSIAGAGRSATASSTEAAAATGRRAAHTVVFIALRQERARLAFLEDCEIKPEVLVVIIRSHIEPLRSQSKIR